MKSRNLKFVQNSFFKSQDLGKTELPKPVTASSSVTMTPRVVGLEDDTLWTPSHHLRDIDDTIDEQELGQPELIFTCESLRQPSWKFV